jgi:signal transduction histidine kinase
VKIGSLRGRLLLGAAIAIAVATVLAGVGLDAISNAAIRSLAFTDIDEEMRVLLANVEIDAANRLLLDEEPKDPRFSRPNGGFYWQIGRGGAVELKSQSLWDQHLPWPPTNKVSLGRGDVAGPDGAHLLAASDSVTLTSAAGDQTVDIVVALDKAQLGPIQRQFYYAVVPSLGILMVCLISAAFLSLGYGLRPLDRLRVALAAVHDRSAQLIGGEFPEEIQPLVDDLNHLISARDAQLERARARAGDLAHGLKTPIAVLETTARGIEAWEPETAAVIRDELRRMELHVRRTLAQARAGLSAATIVTSFEAVGLLRRIVTAMERLSAETGTRFQTKTPDALWMRVDESDFADIAGNLLDNARKWARTTAAIDLLETDNNSITLVVGDDGPGLSTTDIEYSIARGRRLDETIAGSGFGLALVRDLVEAYGGELSFGKSRLGGLEVSVKLPNRREAPPSPNSQP